MELLNKTRDELIVLAKKLEVEYKSAIKDEELRTLVENAMIVRQTRIEEEAREKVRAEKQLERDIEQIKSQALLAGVSIVIPEKPTVSDVIRLKAELGIKTKEPKPAPETIAIENSKKVYCIFHNLEERDVDERFYKGKYRFECWPEKLHVMPQCVIDDLNRTAVAPIYSNVKDPVTGNTISKRTGTKKRFSFEILEDAPDKASFGIVTDPKILSKLMQTV